MDNLLSIRLRAVNPAINVDRVYKVTLGQDLFNHWYVRVAFGRYNTGGASKTRYFDTREEACRFMDTQLKRRFSSPRRIGCPYQVISAEGNDETLETASKKMVERFSWFSPPEAV